MFLPKPTAKLITGILLSSAGHQFGSEFEKLIEASEGDYTDPSRQDLGDRWNSDDDRNKTKRRELFCFHCNRLEAHSPATRFGAFHSFLIGLTLGLVKIIGPYYCRCCGHRRFLGSDRIHPKYWIHQRRLRKLSKGRRSR
jgi:hypothetical protein